jgi:cellulose synthase/poly-beta-1,6-N-acetylglucosamine synthase-like glycosyltransferase
MINIIITSYKEPKSTLRAVQAFLTQNVYDDFKIIVVDPFAETEKYLKENIRDKRVEFFLDPGEGKSYALNILFQENFSDKKGDIFILTDGDVYVSENAVNEIMKAFNDEKVGCVTGKPVSIDDRKTKFGYWSHFLFSGVDKARTELSRKEKFFECSGYLFAIRNGVLHEFPLETSEDSIIPYLFWKKNYKIKYVPTAEVYVKNPDNLSDWKKQKIRNIKGHENLNKIAPDMPRTKSLFNEIYHGWYFLFLFPKNVKEFFWTIPLFFERFSIYMNAFKELKKKKGYSDGWRETEIKSTSPLD